VVNDYHISEFIAELMEFHPLLNGRKIDAECVIEPRRLSQLFTKFGISSSAKCIAKKRFGEVTPKRKMIPIYIEINITAALRGLPDLLKEAEEVRWRTPFLKQDCFSMATSNEGVVKMGEKILPRTRRVNTRRKCFLDVPPCRDIRD